MHAHGQDARRLDLWAYNDSVASARIAAQFGFRPARRLLHLHRHMSDLPAAAAPASSSIRAVRPGVDDQTWLDLNNRIFAGHPENGVWTLDDLRARMAQPWFDARDLLMLEVDGALAGFCWLKVEERPERGPRRRDLRHRHRPRAPGPGPRPSAARPRPRPPRGARRRRRRHLRRRVERVRRRRSTRPPASTTTTSTSATSAISPPRSCAPRRPERRRRSLFRCLRPMHYDRLSEVRIAREGGPHAHHAQGRRRRAAVRPRKRPRRAREAG